MEAQGGDTMLLDPETGFTSAVIRDPKRFVGRQALIQDCMKGLSSPVGLMAIYGKRGVGKSSLLRQVQQMANGDYSIATRAGLHHLIPAKPRRYYTVYYQCDALITSAHSLVTRLCNDQTEDDGLLRLVPDEGKELTEFSRSEEGSAGQDLKILKWGVKGTDASKYARTVPGDVIQTFRNFVEAIVDNNNKHWNKRDAVLILLDEFDVVDDKTGIGSLVKSMSSEKVKFGVCGIARDLTELVIDHKSVERLLEEGAIHVQPMDTAETAAIFSTAESLFQHSVKFEKEAVDRIADLSEGYPYLAQLIGKACINRITLAKVAA
jgi:Cdc6-like AAA superfamily ATPase